MFIFLIVLMSENIYVENVKMMFKIIDIVSIECKINKDICLNFGYVVYYYRVVFIFYIIIN